MEPIVCVTQEDELSWGFGLIQFRNNLNLEILSEDFGAPKKETVINTVACIFEMCQPFLSLPPYILLLRPSPSLSMKVIRHCLS